MKKKLLVGTFWGVVGITVLIFQFTPILGILLAFFALVANREILNVAQVKNKPIIVLSCIVAGIFPLAVEYKMYLTEHIEILKYIDAHISPMVFVLLYLFVLVILMFRKFEITRFEHVAMTLISSLFIPYLMSRIIVIRDMYKTVGLDPYTRSNCVYLTLFVLVCSWITDTMSFIFGSKLGKHKMAPRISPKKTWEGAVGGLLGTAAINIIVWLVFFALSSAGKIKPIFVPLWIVPILSIVLSAISMVGDLAASTIKRNYGIKDFGKLMGDTHGGVMDRFDSAVFVCGAAYVFLEIFEAIRLA